MKSCRAVVFELVQTPPEQRLYFFHSQIFELTINVAIKDPKTIRKQHYSIFWQYEYLVECLYRELSIQNHLNTSYIST